MKRLILALLLCMPVCSFAAGEAEVPKEAQISVDKSESAKAIKKTGDELAAKGDYKKATEEYLKALSLSRESFTTDERAQMAMYMSWAGSYNESIFELKKVIEENPKDLQARVHLARVLSWTGNLDDSLKESGAVLSEHPGNKEAMTVQANALRWKGKTGEAVKIYEKIMEGGEDFEARVGLTYAMLSIGDRKAARENRDRVKPLYPYQEKDYRDLKEAVDAATRPTFDAKASYYNDTDFNQVNRLLFSSGFWINNWKADLKYARTYAQDKTRNNDAEAIFFNGYSKFTDKFGAGAGVGLNLIGNREGTAFLSGHVKADLKAKYADFGASLSRDVLTDTAQLIENAIRATNYGFFASRKFNDRYSLSGNLTYRDYSDDNSAIDFQISPLYSVMLKNPTVAVGYSFRYLGFERQSRGGYYDPDSYFAHKLFSVISYDKGRFYTYLEPYIGYQSATRFGSDSGDIFSGGAAIAGYKIKKNASFEVNAEGGNSAVGTAAGFRYYILGMKLVCTTF
ncbi:MAG: hypothetical protein HYS21_11820 [Deltaproteobacteria bacterium]|nr:hypothetical protein [Deltaproteobacteria bacterium]